MRKFLLTNSIIYFTLMSFVVLAIFGLLDFVFGRETKLGLSEIILVTGIVVWGIDRDAKNSSNND